jgi:predicted GNAT family N-acyltransferase
MTSEEAVNKLEQLDDRDPEQAHLDADAILVEFLASQGFGTVADAYCKAQEYIGFWYA